MPLTEQGFSRLTYNEILQQQITRAKELFGDDADTSEKSVLGKYIRLNTVDFAQQEETLENIYLSRYIDTATGASLDRLAPFAGISRNPPSRATLKLALLNSAAAAATIPMGTKFRTSTGISFHSVSETVIQPSKYANITLECDEIGAIGNVSDTEITFLNAQIANVSIMKTAGFSDGSNAETDIELRSRWKNALSGSGSGTAAAIIGKVSRISGVYDCTVTENSTDEMIALGDGVAISPHTFLTSVSASSDTSETAVAQAILDSKPLGIGTSGKTTVSVSDSAGISHSISFTMNQSFTPLFFIYISGQDEPDFDAETDGQAIKNAIINYVNESKSTLGQTLYASSLYAPIIENTNIRSIKQITLAFMKSSGSSVTIPASATLSAVAKNIKIYVV